MSKKKGFSLIGLEDMLKALMACLKSGFPALMEGETGTGKTSLAIEAAKLLGRPFYRVNLDGGVTPDELIGCNMLHAKNGVAETYFQEGPVPRAMREGAVLLLDEINAALPDTLFVLHSLFEKDRARLFISQTQEEIVPAEGFCVIATMNPSADYAGTRALNHAFLSRFGAVLKFKELLGGKMLKALEMHVPEASASSVATVARVLSRVSEHRAKGTLSSKVGIREGIACLSLEQAGLSFAESFNVAVASKIDQDEIKELSAADKGLFEAVSNPSLAKECADDLLGKMSVGDLVEAGAQVAELKAALKAANIELGELQNLKAALATVSGKKEKVGV